MATKKHRPSSQYLLRKLNQKIKSERYRQETDPPTPDPLVGLKEHANRLERVIERMVAKFKRTRPECQMLREINRKIAAIRRRRRQTQKTRYQDLRRLQDHINLKGATPWAAREFCRLFDIKDQP